MHAKAQGELHGLLVDLPRPRKLGAAVRAACAGARRAIGRRTWWTRQAPVPLLLPTGPQLRFTIGREPACDMTLTDETVSRWHASLMRSDGQLAAGRPRLDERHQGQRLAGQRADPGGSGGLGLVRHGHLRHQGPGRAAPRWGRAA